MHWLAKYPPGNEYCTQTHGDYIRYLVATRGEPIDFDVGTPRHALRDDQFFYEGRVRLDLEI